MKKANAPFGIEPETVERPYFDRKEFTRVLKAAWHQFVRGSRVECTVHKIEIHPDLGACAVCAAEATLKREAEKRKQLRIEIKDVMREVIIEVLTEHGFIKKVEATTEAVVATEGPWQKPKTATQNP